MPLLPGIPYRTYFMAQAAIVDASGRILANRSPEEGEGILMARISPARPKTAPALPAGAQSGDFWISQKRDRRFLFWWKVWNAHARRYYQKQKKHGRFSTGPGETPEPAENRAV
jgi:hypothetical protein